MRFAIVDIETTGLSCTSNRIIEIGVIIVEDQCVVNTFSTLINPGEYISEQITNITGIRSSDVQNAPKFHEIAEALQTVLQNCIFVAHNASFDYGFIQAEFARIKQAFHARALCTVKLSRKLFPQHNRHSLAHIIERFHIQTAARHRAMADAQAVWDFLQILPTHFADEHIQLAIHEVIETHTLTPTLFQSPPRKTFPPISDQHKHIGK